jgi:predicted phosphodiesterase
MTTVQVLSDLHLEFLTPRGGEAFFAGLDPRGVDVLVLAGDVAVGRGIEPVLTRFASIYPEVVFVAGNHEHYNVPRAELLGRLRALDAAIPGFHFLDVGRRPTVAGLRFVGATGWSDPTGRPRWETEGLDMGHMVNASQWMHAVSVEEDLWLAQNAHRAEVVVTHVNPAIKGIASRWIGDACTWYFCTENDARVERCGAPLWICGHTHDPFDITLGTTRVVCNPWGYPHENKRNFREKLVVEVPPYVPPRP